MNGKDITLEEVFGLIFENGTFLSLYDEDVSYLFQNRDNLIAMSKKVHQFTFTGLLDRQFDIYKQ